MRSIGIILFLAVYCYGPTASAEPREPAEHKKKSPYKVNQLKKGTSSWLVLRDAKKKLPLHRMVEPQRQRAAKILKSVSHFRQLPKLQFEVDPTVYRYFTTHPDAAVSIWRVMDISKFQMTETSPRVFKADAGDGSYGVSDIIYQSANECVIICDGVYKNPFLVKPILAKGLVHLTTEYVRSPKNKPAVVHRANVFIMFPSSTVKTAAKVISPLTNSIMDRNFHEISIFVQMMSMAMERQPAWVQKIVSGMDGVPAARRTELMAITRQVRNQATRRNMTNSMVDPPVSVDELTEPFVTLPLGQLDLAESTDAAAKSSETNSSQTKSADGIGRVRLSSGTDSGSVQTASQRTSGLPVVIPGLLSRTQTANAKPVKKANK